jgi:hypothetical protein
VYDYTISGMTDHEGHTINMDAWYVIGAIRYRLNPNSFIKIVTPYTLRFSPTLFK